MGSMAAIDPLETRTEEDPLATLEMFSMFAEKERLQARLAECASYGARVDVVLAAGGEIPNHLARALGRLRAEHREVNVACERIAATSWRGLVQGIVTQAQTAGSSLPTFDGHTDFITELRTHLQATETAESYIQFLSKERQRWKLSLFGRKKLRVIDAIVTELESKADATAEVAHRKAHETYRERLETASRNLETDLGSIANWYRHLLAEAVDTSDRFGSRHRWRLIDRVDDGFLALLQRVWNDPMLVRWVNRAWQLLDEGMSDQLQSWARKRVQDTRPASVLQVADVLAREIEEAAPREKRMNTVMQQWPVDEPMQLAIAEALAETTAWVSHTAETVLRRSSVTTVATLFEALKSEIKDDAAAIIGIRRALTTMQPFAALKDKTARISTYRKQLNELYEGLLL
jgi:hypothetical protein